MLNVLVPLDGSELAERAISHALPIVESFVAKVTLLRVITPAEFRSQETFDRVDWRLHKHQAFTYLRNVAQTFEAATVPFELRVEEGRPADIILETARELGTQLLVMSTHGRGGAVDYPRGGVASKTLSGFGGSVLLVGSGVMKKAATKVHYRRLLVPVDGSHRSECAMRVAMMLAKSLDAELIIACIAEQPELPHIVRDDRKAASLQRDLADLTRAAAERRLHEIEAQIPEDIALRTAVLLARRPADELSAAARRFDADLLIASENLFNGSLGSLDRQMAGTQVPTFILSPKNIGSAFCELRTAEGDDVANADVI